MMSETTPPRVEFAAVDHERGQGLAEYALILGLIAIVAIASMLFLGDVINGLLSMIGSTVDSSTLNG